MNVIILHQILLLLCWNSKTSLLCPHYTMVQQSLCESQRVCVNQMLPNWTNLWRWSNSKRLSNFLKNSSLLWSLWRSLSQTKMSSVKFREFSNFTITHDSGGGRNFDSNFTCITLWCDFFFKDIEEVNKLLHIPKKISLIRSGVYRKEFNSFIFRCELFCTSTLPAALAWNLSCWLADFLVLYIYCEQMRRWFTTSCYPTRRYYQGLIKAAIV